MRISFFVLALPVVLTGCAFGPKAAPSAATALAINGNVHGGQQPVSGAHVYLYAANTTGYGNPSVSLLEAADGTVSDSDGNYYVTTDASGGFTITGDYTCTLGQQVYLYAQGGNPGSGPNSSAGFLAVMGSCPGGTFATEVPFVEVNEVTTVAAAYALSGFATDPTHVADDEAVVSNPTAALARTGMANAFVNASNLADISSGSARSMTPSGSGIVPQATIDTLANILAACINSTGAVTGPDSPTACYTLLNSALYGGTSGTVPADTAAAAINIAHHPALNIAALYGLASSRPPFGPSLTTVPNDFSLGLVFTGGGISQTGGMAVDAIGNVWSTNVTTSEVTEISSAGAFLSGSQGYTAGAYEAYPVAIDTSGHVWIGNGAGDYNAPGSVIELSSSGTLLSPANGYTADSIETPQGLAIDANGDIWVANHQKDDIAELSSSGQVLSGANGFTGGGIIINPDQLAISPSGNVWSSNAGYLAAYELSSSGAFLALASTGMSVPATSIAIDHQGNIWEAGTSDMVSQVSELSPGGAIMSGSGYTIPNPGRLRGGPASVAIDGDGDAWIALYHHLGIVELSNSRVPLSGAVGYGSGVLDFVGNIVVDGSGDIWISTGNLTTTNSWSITELIGIAAPVVTPIAAGVQLNMLGARP